MGPMASTCVREMLAGTESSDLLKCMQTKMIMAVEPSGMAARHCNDGDIDAAFECALQGVLLIKLREKSNTPIKDSVWDDLEAVLAGEAVVAALEEGIGCMKIGATGQELERSCMVENYATRLGGEVADARLCLALKTDALFGQCLGEAAALNLLESAVKRLGS